jgi:type IV secretory pathway protease TraF
MAAITAAAAMRMKRGYLRRNRVTGERVAGMAESSVCSMDYEIWVDRDGIGGLARAAAVPVGMNADGERSARRDGWKGGGMKERTLIIGLRTV